MYTSSMGGCNYFLIFIDDYTRKNGYIFSNINLMHLVFFQQFKALVENWSGHRIKILRTDRGGEYVSIELLNFYKTLGTKNQFTAWYTPQQNDVTKIKNITIMEMVCSMMATKHFPNEYWDEAVTTTIYIMN